LKGCLLKSPATQTSCRNSRANGSQRTVFPRKVDPQGVRRNPREKGKNRVLEKKGVGTKAEEDQMNSTQEEGRRGGSGKRKKKHTCRDLTNISD